MSKSICRQVREQMRPKQRFYTRDTPFVDRVKLLVASGTGGDGTSKMLHLCNEEFAGPGGGNGGRGGHVYLRCSRTYPDLAHVQAHGKYVVAGAGGHGKTRVEHGGNGPDLTLDLPPGTQVLDVDTQEVLFDLDETEQEFLLLEGGTGGKGNAAFKSAIRHSPQEATKGLPGNSMLTQFELKSIADVGLVGFPNAGKSSVLSAVSTCRPRVAPYPFTTLHPHIGRLHDVRGNTCDIADIPGVIEGAYENRGLGHEFLRHIERTQMLCYVVDVADSYVASDSERAMEPWEALEVLQLELEYYLPGLSERATVALVNKMDVGRDAAGISTQDKVAEVQRRFPHLAVFPVSAKTALEQGPQSPASGLPAATEYICRRVFAVKAERREEKRRAAQEEAAECAEIFRDTNRALFPAAAAQPTTAPTDDSNQYVAYAINGSLAATAAALDNRTDRILNKALRDANARAVEARRKTSAQPDQATSSTSKPEPPSVSKSSAVPAVPAADTKAVPRSRGPRVQAVSRATTARLNTKAAAAAERRDGPDPMAYGVHDGARSAVRLDSLEAGASLVDQQMGDPALADGHHSGYTEADTAYLRLPETGRMGRMRDHSLDGAYWRLTRPSGEE